MSVTKLPSGNYRIRQNYEGVTYSTTINHKPTNKEVAEILAELMKEVPGKHEPKTFEVACKDYIKLKENVLSPRTVREYTLYINRLPQWFTKMNVNSITQNDVQKLVNELAETKSPKTIYSLHGYVSGVLSSARPNMKLTTTLPQKIKKEPYVPNNDVVKRFLEYVKEDSPMFYVPIFLGGLSVRRSELLALTPDDIDKDGFLHIDKAKVQNVNGDWVIKQTKTTESTRTIPLPADIIEIIQENGYVYNGAAQSISNYMRRTQDKLKMEHFSLHKMRHYCCSRIIEMGYSIKDAQEFCGWSTDATAKAVYLHSLKMKNDDEKRKVMNDIF